MEMNISLKESLTNRRDVFLSVAEDLDKLLKNHLVDDGSQFEFDLEKMKYLESCLNHIKEKQLSNELTVLVTGQSGVKKSRLIDEFISSTEKDFDLIQCIPVKYTYHCRLQANIIFVNYLNTQLNVSNEIDFQSAAENLSEEQIHLDEDEEDQFVLLEIGIPSPVLELGLSIIDLPFSGENIDEKVDLFAYFQPHIVMYLYDQPILVKDSAYIRKMQKSLKLSSVSYKLIFLPNIVCHEDIFNIEEEMRSLEKRFLTINDSSFIIPMSLSAEYPKEHVRKVSSHVRDIGTNVVLQLTKTISKYFSPGNFARTVGKSIFQNQSNKNQFLKELERNWKIGDHLIEFKNSVQPKRGSREEQQEVGFFLKDFTNDEKQAFMKKREEMLQLSEYLSKQFFLSLSRSFNNTKYRESFTNNPFEAAVCKKMFENISEEYMKDKHCQLISFDSIDDIPDIAEYYSIRINVENYFHFVHENSIELCEGSMTKITRDILTVWFRFKSHTVPLTLQTTLTSKELDNDNFNTLSDNIQIKRIEDENNLYRVSLTSRDKLSVEEFNKESLRLYTYFHDQLLYQTEDESNLYLIYPISKDSPRLLDILHSLDFPKIICILSFCQRELWKNSIRQSFCFRPDNIYVKRWETKSPIPICYFDIPANHSLKLMLRNNQLVKPFYLPANQALSPNATLMYKFGWFMWILLEGSGMREPSGSEPNEWFESMKSGRFGDKIEMFEELIKSCWRVCESNVYQLKDLINTELNIASNRTKSILSHC